MVIIVQCPVCTKTLQAPQSAAGKGCACPLCHALVTIPLEDVEPPEYIDEPRRRRRRRRFLCPYCGTDERPIESKRITTAGWVVFVVFLIVLWPLFWIGLLITERETRCYDCRRRLDE